MSATSLPIPAEPAKGFLSSLFDLSFTSFITTRIIKMLYMISMICATLTAGFMVILGAVMHQGGLLVVLLAPAVFILMVAYSRVMLELAIVFFRIAENTAVLPRLAAGESNTKMIAFTS